MNNNLNITDMNKTRFTGTINGQTFDNVSDYNAKMQELLDAGATINASSSTYVAKTLDTKKQTKPALQDSDAEDLSFYPYMEEDDPFYLDLLVTDDEEVNAEAIDEMHKYFDRCLKYIVNNITDENNCVETLKQYREVLRDIIDNCKDDYKDTKNCQKTILEKLNKTKSEYEDVCARFEAQLNDYQKQYNILKSAEPVINEVVKYYETIENEVVSEIGARKATKKNAECTCGNCDNTCTCDCHETQAPIETTISEERPQKIVELSDIIESIFGTDWFSSRHTRHLV